MKQTFAVLAVLFVLLRPVCDVLAAESGHDGGSDTLCCADIEDGALAKVSEKAGTPGGPEATLAAPALLAVLDPGAPGPGALDPSALPRTPASFYVRSARIRR